MKLAICNEIFAGWSPDRLFPYAAGLGYDFVEIAPFTLGGLVTDIDASRRREIRESAAANGIGISGLHWVLAKTEGLQLNSPEAETRQRTSTYFKELVDCCADLGGTRIILGSPQQRMVLPGTSREQAGAWALETLKPAVRLAEDRQVVICLEPLGPAETNFLNTAQEALELAAEMNSPALSIILDVKAMSTEARPIPEIIRGCAGRFAYFHANDPNRKGPGFGEVDYLPILTALSETGYDGIISVEVFDFTEGPERIATESISYLHAQLAKAGAS